MSAHHRKHGQRSRFQLSLLVAVVLGMAQMVDLGSTMADSEPAMENPSGLENVIESSQQQTPIRMTTQNNTPKNDKPTEFALFAGGCFWCMEPPFDKIEGVIETLSGYAGGHLPNPTYKDVTGGNSGHLEVIQIRYNPNEVGYQRLLQTFWQNVDFLDNQGQFCDRGSSYAPAVFALDERQREIAETSLKELRALFPETNTPIRDSTKFYPAENYHQNYYQKNPLRYKYYRWNCGRDQRLSELAQLKKDKETTLEK